MAKEYYIRKARIQDVKRMHGMLLASSQKGELLPRSLNDLYGQIRDYFVAAPRESGDIVGCCALSICWEDWAEIRSLVIDPSVHGQGLGKKLVEACLSEAVTLGLYQVFALTYQVDFFTKLNFSLVDKDRLPQKVWADCIHCAKFPDCDETAMIIEL